MRVNGFQKEWKKIKERCLNAMKEKGFGRVRAEQMVLLILAGILLLILTPDLPGRKEKRGKDSADPISQEIAGGQTGGEKENFAYAGQLCEDYRRELEEELEELLKSLDGAGEVRVMVTLAGTEKRIVLTKEKRNTQKTIEKDKNGGMREKEEVAGEEEVICSGLQGEKGMPYVIQMRCPEVEGIVVLAEGAGKGRVRSDITEAIQALFHLEAHKIKVLKMGYIPQGTGIE